MRTTVSAVIPCYNAAPFLAEAIGSVRAQTRPVDEILVVDDGSTDGSPELAEQLGARVVRTPRNAGAAAARNLGLREARGELVALLDADDLWEPEHCAVVVGLLESFPEAVLAFGRVTYFGDASGEWPALLPAGQPVRALEACLRRSVLPQNAVVLRREMVLAAGGYNEGFRRAHDFDLWLRLSARHPFVCTHAITARWRHHGAQLSGNIVPYWAIEYESRRRFLDECRSSAPELVPEVERVMREVWEGHLLNAWQSRRPQHLAFHLGMAHLVPGAMAARNRWRARRLLMPLARLWDALPRRLKARIRPRRPLPASGAG